MASSLVPWQQRTCRGALATAPVARPTGRTTTCSALPMSKLLPVGRGDRRGDGSGCARGVRGCGGPSSWGSSENRTERGVRGVKPFPRGVFTRVSWYLPNRALQQADNRSR